jgi:dTDP-4-dehydrorhamnose reductase
MKKILIIGKGGQVSSNLIELLATPDYKNKFEFLALGQNELDLSKPSEVLSKLNNTGYKPDIIINAAAYTAVDLAEDERELCNNINNISVAEIAKFATKHQALLIHYSTDYVYNGEGNSEFQEADESKTNPVNYYGKTKLDGEKQIIKSGCNYLILRTSWVYNHAGKNFVLTILRLAQEKEELKIINDQVGSPTYAFDIAVNSLLMAEKFNGKSGIYHFVAPEKISWFNFTNLIFAQAKELNFKITVKNISPIASSQYPTKAARPLNSRLSVKKLENNYGIIFPKISDSLKACLKNIKP